MGRVRSTSGSTCCSPIRGTSPSPASTTSCGCGSSTCPPRWPPAELRRRPPVLLGVHDPFLEANAGVYRIAGGTAERVEPLGGPVAPEL